MVQNRNRAVGTLRLVSVSLTGRPLGAGYWVDRRMVGGGCSETLDFVIQAQLPASSRQISLETDNDIRLQAVRRTAAAADVFA